MLSDWGSIPPPLTLGLRATGGRGDVDGRLLVVLLFIVLVVVAFVLEGAVILGRRC